MRVGHRRDIVADDPEIATRRLELHQLIAREEAPRVSLLLRDNLDRNRVASGSDAPERLVVASREVLP
jgi:hypothetical protein